MPKGAATFPETTIDELIESGAVSLVNGFACGEHNSNGDGVLQVRPFNVAATGAIDLNEQKHIPPAAANGKPTLIRNDIIFNNTNTKELVGKTALWDGPDGSVFSNHMTRLRVLGEQISPRYLATALHAHWLTGKSQMLARQHVAQASMLGERFREIAFPWPPFLEQEALARVFLSLHASLSAEAQTIETARALKRTAMRALFTRGLGGEAVKETEIGPVPESWEVASFGSVRQWLQYGTSVRCTYEKTEFPVLRIPNIEAGRVNQSDLKFGSLVPAEADRYRLENGDLIFIRTNGVIERLGTTAVFCGQPENALFASYLIRARLKTDMIDPYFAAHYFGSEQGTSIVTGRATSASDGKYNLNTGTIDSLPIPLPPSLGEQREIVAILDAIDRKIELHRKKRAVLDELFKALLHKLMTGEIRVTDLDLSALDSKGDGADLNRHSGEGRNPPLNLPDGGTAGPSQSLSSERGPVGRDDDDAAEAAQ
jgi:type I restriction enzyme, S subunit